MTNEMIMTANPSVNNDISKVMENKEGLEFLGHLVFWNLENVSINVNELKEIFERNNIPSKYIKPHNYKSSLSRAIKQLEKEKIIRIIKDDSSFLVIQFTKEINIEFGEGENEFRYNTDMKITINKDIYKAYSGCPNAFEKSIVRDNNIKLDENDMPIKNSDGSFVRIEDSEEERIIKDKIIELFYIEKDSIKSVDINRIIQKVFKENADIISLRKQGSIYYIPHKFYNIVVSMSNIINSLKDKCEFNSIPLIKTPNTEDLIADAFQRDIDSIISAVDNDIESVILDEKSEDWFKIRANRINKLKSRIDLYSDILNDNKKEVISNKIKESKKRLLGNRKINF